MIQYLDLFLGIGGFKFKDFHPFISTSADVVMKASGLRLEAIRMIAREQGVEIEDSACRCIDESLLAELADAHVRRLKAYFNNAKRHIAELAGDEMATFVDFCKTFKKSHTSDTTALTWSDIDTDAIKEQFTRKVHQLTPSNRLGSLFGIDKILEICEKSLNTLTTDTQSSFDAWLTERQRDSILDSVQHSWLYYEKTFKPQSLSLDVRQIVRRVTLSARYHIYTSNDDHIAC